MLSRVHSLLGVVPLGTYLLWHVYENWPALHDREAWVDRALHGPSRAWAIAWVLVPLALHAGLGVVRLRRAAADQLTGPRGLRVLQAATGVLVLAFVVYHVQQVWVVSEGPHADQRASYAVLWRTLGRPLDLTIYLIGITALCFHVAHGLSRAAVTFRLARTPRAALHWRYGASAFGFALWFALLQLLGHFALGEPLIG
jgi:succinate dehydrogenase / fumarate reductase cytochrome b subunit